jgi:hypothetical protein
MRYSAKTLSLRRCTLSKIMKIRGLSRAIKLISGMSVVI